MQRFNAEIAEEIGCNRRRLAYYFDKEVGMSPIQFLTEMRLKHSKHIFCTTTRITFNDNSI